VLTHACIRYNVLNLPDTIQFGNGRQIINSYDAGGHKLTTQYYTPIGTVIVTQGSIHGGYTTANSVLRLDDYCGSYLYDNRTSASVHPLTKILTPEGYIDMSTSGYPYCYYKQDHWGSNREVTSYAGTTGTVVQQTEYYPSGTAYVEGTGAGIQPFKFTGKELIIMHGLNWQDYGARWLDNVRMEWTTMDPLCEKYYAISPYTYCSDDPAKNIDPDGSFQLDPQTAKNYPALVDYYKNLSEIFQNKPQEFKDAFYESSGLNKQQTSEMLQYGKGPTITVENLDKNGKQIDGVTLTKNNGEGKTENVNHGQGVIKIDDKVANMLQKAETPKEKQIGSIMLEVVTFHEGTHYGNNKVNNNENGKYDESGFAFEKKAYGRIINRNDVSTYWYYLQPQKLATPQVFIQSFIK
jgi:RHS repeat-associated protein